MTSADRRRSGRGVSAKKNYADRPDSEDEKEVCHPFPLILSENQFSVFSFEIRCP